MSSSSTERLPVDLVDVFSLREPVSLRTSIVAVARCLGGGLSVYTGESLERLADQEPDLARQLQAVAVAHRGKFRVVTAADLLFCTLDALKQDAQVTGFNDPLRLHGTTQARIAWADEGTSLTPLDNQGRLTVGRLDFLTGYRISAPHAFENPVRESGRVYPFLLPLTPTEEIEQGHGLALAYALLDPQDSRQVDNTVLVLSFVHSVLTQLQHDLGQARSGDPLATTRSLPVPNRLQIEQELEGDGYEITGSIAVKRSSASKTATVKRSGLQRLLDALGFDQSSSRVALPAQASPSDYERLIGEFVSAVATPDDRRMFDALTNCLDKRVRANYQPSTIPQTPVSIAAASVQPIQPVVHPSVPISPSNPMTKQRKTGREQRNDFSADFEPSLSPVPATDRAEWTDDFLKEDVSGHKGPDQADMSADFPSPSHTSRRDTWAQTDRFTNDFDPPDEEATSTSSEESLLIDLA